VIHVSLLLILAALGMAWLSLHGAPAAVNAAVGIGVVGGVTLLAGVLEWLFD
jgi:hypothetical protein